MHLFTTTGSPWTRKCIVTIIELGIEDKVKQTRTRWPHIWATQTVPFTPEFAAATPVGRIPALVTDDGLRLCDSFAICDYLNLEYGQGRLLPAAGPQRWKLTSIMSIANGLLEAQILRRGELLRHGPEQSDDFLKKMVDREKRCYAALDGMISHFDADIDLAQIQLAVCCGYADFRFPQEDWRTDHPNIARWSERFFQRPSMQRTIHAETPQ